MGSRGVLIHCMRFLSVSIHWTVYWTGPLDSCNLCSSSVAMYDVIFNCLPTDLAKILLLL